MGDIHLSKHFRDNWEERVGICPTPRRVEEIVSESVIVQRGRGMVLKDGSFYNTLSIYWHPDLKIVVTIDPIKRTAVSVLSSAVLK